MTHHLLKHDNKPLRYIMEKLDELQRYHHLLAKYLNPELVKHCHVVKYEKNCLFVIVDNGNWTTQFRFEIPDLLNKLRTVSGLEKLSGIICKTRPHHSFKIVASRKRKLTKLSLESSKKILESADTIQDKKLRSIMEKIASYLAD